MWLCSQEGDTNMTETKQEKGQMKMKVNNIIQSIKSGNTQFGEYSIYGLYKLCNRLRKSNEKRKIQNMKDHNLLSIFKEKYPKEFLDSLKEYKEIE